MTDARGSHGLQHPGRNIARPRPHEKPVTGVYISEFLWINLGWITTHVSNFLLFHEYKIVSIRKWPFCATRRQSAGFCATYHVYVSAQSLDFLELAQNCLFPNWKHMCPNSVFGWTLNRFLRLAVLHELFCMSSCNRRLIRGGFPNGLSEGSRVQGARIQAPLPLFFTFHRLPDGMPRDALRPKFRAQAKAQALRICTC